MAQPYIPAAHKKYDLLPSCCENGGEVFSYPRELDVVEDALAEAEGTAGLDRRTSLLIPYGMGSYEEYYALVQSYADKHRGSNPELADMLEALIEMTKAMNVKEDWSILRFTGDQFDGDEYPSLTKGQCYYWPCSRLNPVYEGVIDNEEFTSYLYPCDPNSWEILEDPTGMAARALGGDADDVPFWKIETSSDPESLEAWAVENGLGVKRMLRTSMVDAFFDEWGDSEVDVFPVTCPNCGKTHEHGTWTKVNAKRDPDMAARLREGTFFEYTCPECGFVGNLIHPCLYLDPVNSACVYFVLSEDFAKGVEGMFDGFSEDGEHPSIASSKKRIVASRESLRDKAIAFSNNLNDGALELLKTGISGQAKMQGQIPPDSACAINLIDVIEDDCLVLRLEWDDDSLIAEIPVGALDLFSDALEKSGIGVPESYYVDRQWADDTIDVLDAMGIMD